MKPEHISGRGTTKSTTMSVKGALNRWVTIHGNAGVANPETAVTGHDRAAVQPASDEVAVLCWCERSTVWVPQAVARAGSTLACGTKRCAGPNGEREVGERTKRYAKGTR